MVMARLIAEMRRRMNRSEGVVDRLIDPHPRHDPDLLGAMSELAFCKTYNVYPDLSVSPRRGGADVNVGPVRVDVKSTHRENGSLLATVKKRSDDADVYVLTTVNVDQNAVTLVGWAAASELLCEATLTDLGHGPTHALSQDKLHHFSPRSKDA